MSFLKLTLPVAMVAVLAVVMAGCSSSDVKEASGVPSSSESNSGSGNDEMNHDGMNHDEHAMHDHSAYDHASQRDKNMPEELPAAKSDMGKMMETLASFSDEDRASAMKQHFCPVSGEMLGVMGTPEKVDVNGESVWICCDGCKDKLLADPDNYLAKLTQ